MTTLNLQQFCSRSDDERKHLHQPWPQQGWMYAANGHIMIRVPSAEHAAATATHGAASAPAMFDAAGKANYIELPSFAAPARCDCCAGVGQYLKIDCPDCDGKGEFTHGTHLYDCQRCLGDGIIRAAEGEVGATMQDCPKCFGIGVLRGTFVPVGDVGYDSVYLSWIAKLPNARVCTNGEKAMHFVFDGGEGLLMPRRAD